MGCNLFNSEFYLTVEDLRIPGVGFDFLFRRTYRSRTGEDTPMGHRWDHTYNVSLEESGPDSLLLRCGLGRSDTFYRQADGTFGHDGFFMMIDDPDVDGRMDLFFADSGRWTFHAFDGTPTAGHLVSSMDRNSNTMTFAYSPLGLLTNVVDTLGRGIDLTYNPDGRLVSVTDFAGRSVTYDYYGLGDTNGSPGDLKSVTMPAVTGTPTTNDFPLGKKTVYSYTTTNSTGQTDDRALHNLASITDPKQQVALQIDYATGGSPQDWNFGGAVALHRDGAKLDVWRDAMVPSPSNRYAAVRTVVNDWVGNVSEYDYDSRNRLVAVRRYTGRAAPGATTTDTQNRPVNPLRSTDPPWYETLYTWNRDSLVSEVVHPAGNLDRYLYASDLLPGLPRTHGGDLALCECRPPPHLTSQGGLTEVYQHHAVFGSDSTRELGAGAAALQGLNRFPALGMGGALDFVTSVTDSRRNATHYTYDARGNVTSVVSPEPGATQDYEYSADGRCTAQVHPPDGNGQRRRDEFTYYSSGPQRGYRQFAILDVGSPIIPGMGLVTSNEYDSVGNVKRVLDARGNDTLYEYNALNQLVRTESPEFGTSLTARVKSEFIYDANDNLVRLRTENKDETGAVGTPAFFDVFYDYDPIDNLTQRVDVVDAGSTITTHYEYDDNRNRVLVRTPEAVSGGDPTNVITCVYDERDLLFETTRAGSSPVQSTDQFTYDQNRNLTLRVEDMERPGGAASTASEYDGFNRLTNRIDAMGNGMSYEYDPNGNVVRRRIEGEHQDNAPDGLGNKRLGETRFTYDTINRCTSRIDSFFDIWTEVSIGDGEAETRYTYAPDGTVLSVWDDIDRTTVFEYDSLGRVTAATDPGTNTVAYSYDAVGNVTNVQRTHHLGSGGSGSTVYLSSYGYDNLDRLIVATDWYRCATGTVCGVTNRFLYDGRDNRVGEIDARGNETRYVYDGLNRRIRVERLDGTFARGGKAIGTTSYLYDDNSRCVAVTDSNTNTTQYLYDSLDRVTSRRLADLGEHLFVWQSRLDLGSCTDPNGTVTTYTYDHLHRRRSVVVTPGSGVATNTTHVTYDYDGLSRVVSAQNDGALCQFKYDSLGNVVRETLNGRDTTYTYDSLGNRLSTTLPGGSTSYTYDSLDRVTGTAFTPTGGIPVVVENVLYDGPRPFRVTRGNGLLTDLTYGGNVAGPPNVPGDANTGLPSWIHHGDLSGTGTLSSIVCVYDANQNCTNRTVLPVVPQTAGTYVFELDALNRLARSTAATNATLIRDRTYTYDGIDNRVTVTGFPGAGSYTRDPALPVPGDHQVNQYTSTPYDQRQYDENGNLVVRSTATEVLHYRYDYADRLVAISNATRRSEVVTYEYDALDRCVSRTDVATRVRTDYCYDGRDVAEEFTNNASARIHITGTRSHDDGLVRSFTWTQDQGPYWYHTDDGGSVVALSDASSNVIERYTYDEFGLPSIQTPDGQPRGRSMVDNVYLYGGVRWDAATMLYRGEGASGAVQYDPLVGRTTTRTGSGSSASRVVVRGWNPKEKSALKPPRVGIVLEFCGPPSGSFSPYSAVAFPVDGSGAMGNASAWSYSGFPGSPCRASGGGFPVAGSAVMGNVSAWSYSGFPGSPCKASGGRIMDFGLSKVVSVSGGGRNIIHRDLKGGDYSGISGYTYVKISNSGAPGAGGQSGGGRAGISGFPGSRAAGVAYLFDPGPPGFGGGGGVYSEKGSFGGGMGIGHPNFVTGRGGFDEFEKEVSVLSSLSHPQAGGGGGGIYLYGEVPGISPPRGTMGIGHPRARDDLIYVFGGNRGGGRGRHDIGMKCIRNMR
jgi:YD repeat-containing protein